jgi:hypothetical protein
MNEYVVSSLPIVGSMANLVVWLLLMNVLLLGGVILLAYRLASVSERLSQLETGEASESATLRESVPEQPKPPAVHPPLSPVDDDRPIPLVRHRFGSPAGIMRRYKGEGKSPDLNPSERQ